MTKMTLSEFAGQVTEMMPAIMREFYKHESSGLEKIRITLPQLVVLNILAREGELSMTDLAKCINVTTAAMTGIVDRLVRDGYVVRLSMDGDRRIIKVKTTAKGAKAARSAIEHQRGMVEKLFSVLSEEERGEYLRILTIVRDRLKGERVDKGKDRG